MTEAEWLACKDPNLMLESLRHEASDRKLRLFAVACGRVFEARLVPKGSMAIIECAERYADGVASAAELESSLNRALVAYRELHDSFIPSDPRAPYNEHAIAARPELGVAAAIAGVVRDTSSAAVSVVTLAGGALLPSNSRLALIRDIFGNTFHPVAFDSAWRTDTALSLARQMYESRAFGAMPILADALQDAGCTSEDVLGHCRDPQQVHVRGCWVVDQVLGKE